MPLNLRQGPIDAASAPDEPGIGPPPVRGDRPRPPFARLRSTLGVALLPCALAATVIWLGFLLWIAVALIDLPFR